MIPDNKQTALMLWQGRELVKLHNNFMLTLKEFCYFSLTLSRPLDTTRIVKHIDTLEADCDKVLRETEIPAKKQN